MRSSRQVIRAIVWGGLIAGTLDIADALLFNGLRGVPPMRLLQAIASGLLGRDAFSGGAATAALGLALHFFIATSVAAVYALSSLRLPVLLRRPWLCGTIYGLGVHLVMKFVVLPLSQFRPGRAPAAAGVDWALVNLVLAHVLFVGIPVALCARRALGRR
jgi:uncharacterized membrane protein YagU involved in acid resistance